MHWQPQGVSPGVARRGTARRGRALQGEAQRGAVWTGLARQGLQTAVRRASAFPTALSGADAARLGGA